MMKVSEEIAKYFPNAEIIELHHNHKFDAPSGTAKLTAEKLLQPVHCIPMKMKQKKACRG